MKEVLTQQPDIHSKFIIDNETWNTCCRCNKNWKDDIPTPGLLHRTVICQSCLFEMDIVPGGEN